MKILLFDASATIQKVVKIIFDSDELVVNPSIEGLATDFDVALLDDKFVNLIPKLQVPYILMSGALSEKVDVDAEYKITKPFESKALVDLVNRVINEHTSSLYENTFAYEPEQIYVEPEPIDAIDPEPEQIKEVLVSSQFKTELEKIITEQIMLITADIVREKLTSKMIIDKLEAIVWEVVPDIAELEIKKQIGRLMPL